MAWPHMRPCRYVRFKERHASWACRLFCIAGWAGILCTKGRGASTLDRYELARESTWMRIQWGRSTAYLRVSEQSTTQDDIRVDEAFRDAILLRGGTDKIPVAAARGLDGSGWMKLFQLCGGVGVLCCAVVEGRLLGCSPLLGQPAQCSTSTSTSHSTIPSSPPLLQDPRLSLRRVNRRFHPIVHLSNTPPTSSLLFLS